MKAFLNCKYDKDQAVAIAQKHYDDDRFIKGTYAEGEYRSNDFRGCHIGCMTGGRNHHLLPELFGIDERLGGLGEAIFEGLPEGESEVFTLDFYKSIKTGTDTTRIVNQFFAWLILDPEHGVTRFSEDERVSAVGELFKQSLTREVLAQEWKDAARTAADAARTAAAVADAAWSAADAAWSATGAAWSAMNDALSADYSVYAAEYAADSAATGAAWSATDAAADADAVADAVARFTIAWAAARTKHFQIMRDKLIELFSAEIVE